MVGADKKVCELVPPVEGVEGSVGLVWCVRGVCEEGSGSLDLGEVSFVVGSEMFSRVGHGFGKGAGADEFNVLLEA